MPEKSPAEARAIISLNVVGILLVLICIASSLIEVIHGRLPVRLDVLAEPGLLEAFVKTMVTAVLLIALHLILGRRTPVEARVRNDQDRQ